MPSFLTMLLVACGDAPEKSAPVDTAPEVGDTAPVDGDGDGHPLGVDCDDADPDVHPEAEEGCDGLDQDCDGEVDEGVMRAWYPDEDGDGLGLDGPAKRACDRPEGYASTDGDCDDTDPFVLDERTWFQDLDGDGHGHLYIQRTDGCARPEGAWARASGDCDDTDAAVNPAAEDRCDDGVDSDCDGADAQCALNTEGLTNAPCSPLAPHDQVGAVWSFEDTNDSLAWEWTVENLGEGEFEGISVWRVRVHGWAHNRHASFQDHWDTELGLTCEEDGLHLVYEDRRDAVYSHYSSITESFQRFPDRPLLLPASLERGDTWTVEALRLASSPSVANVLDYDEETVFTVGGTTTLEIGGQDLALRRVNITHRNGSTSSWWLHEGLGLVRMYMYGSLRAEAMGWSGLAE